MELSSLKVGDKIHTDDKYVVAVVCKHDKFQNSTVCKQKEFTILKFVRVYDNKTLYTQIYYSNMPIDKKYELPKKSFAYRHLSDNTD